MSETLGTPSWWVRKPIEWLVVAALGVSGTLLVQYVSEKRQTLSYHFTSSQLIDPVVSGMQGVSLTIGDETLSEPNIVTLSISNTGNAEITDTDLFVLIGTNVHSYFLATDRPAVRDALIWKAVQDGYRISLPTLNEEDHLSFVFVLDGEPTRDLSLDASSPGLKLREASTPQTGPLAILTVIGGIIGVGLALLTLRITSPIMDELVEALSESLLTRLGIDRNSDRSTAENSDADEEP